MQVTNENLKYEGRHYETGVIVNTLAAMGYGLPESMALGASGGIAFGYFVFEYTGHLPHVALLTRNTFAPFERTMDNLGIRRELFETVKPDRGEENLRRELDFGNPCLVWASVSRLPHRELGECFWGAQPLLVVGYDQDGYHVVDGADTPYTISAETLRAARAEIKKDRYRVMTLSRPREEALGDGVRAALATCAALYLDKPPAGASHNFGIAGMAQMSKMLRDEKSALGWGRKFEAGPRLMMALAGSWIQPGIWDWVETWGTRGGADRETYADFLDAAAGLLSKPELASAAQAFRTAAPLWSGLAECALPDALPEFKELKNLKRERSRRRRQGQSAADLKALMAELGEAAGAKLEAFGRDIREAVAARLDEIAPIEHEAVLAIRRS